MQKDAVQQTAVCVRRGVTVLVALMVSGCSYFTHPKPHGIAGHPAWTPIYDLKKLNADYIPQGIELYRGHLLLTVDVQQHASRLLVFAVSRKANGAVALQFQFPLDYPKTAQHISDLAMWHGRLYGIDYPYGTVYVTDIRRSIRHRTMHIIQKIPTHIKGGGSLAWARQQHHDRMLVSKFSSGKSIDAYRPEDFKQAHSTPRTKIHTVCLVQGLSLKGDTLLVSANTIGTDLIYIARYHAVMRAGALSPVNADTVPAPGDMVEDLVPYRHRIITSDEASRKIYISRPLL